MPILLGSVNPPLGFRNIQAADLTDWKPGSSSPHFDQLLQDIAGIVGAKPYQPAPPGKLTPPIRPVRMNRNKFLIGAMVALVLAIIVVLALLSSQGSRVPKTTPGITVGEKVRPVPKDAPREGKTAEPKPSQPEGLKLR